MFRDAYLGHLKVYGEEYRETLASAGNYVTSLISQMRLEEARSLSRIKVPVTRSVLGESHDITLKMRRMYARALYEDPRATLDELREALTTLEDLELITQRVLGSAHPTTTETELHLQNARAVLSARETPS